MTLSRLFPVPRAFEAPRARRVEGPALASSSPSLAAHIMLRMCSRREYDRDAATCRKIEIIADYERDERAIIIGRSTGYPWSPSNRDDRVGRHSRTTFCDEQTRFLFILFTSGRIEKPEVQVARCVTTPVIAEATEPEV